MQESDSQIEQSLVNSVKNLIEELKTLITDCDLAFVYGSPPWSVRNKDGDIDIVVIGAKTSYKSVFQRLANEKHIPLHVWSIPTLEEFAQRMRRMLGMGFLPDTPPITQIDDWQHFGFLPLGDMTELQSTLEECWIPEKGGPIPPEKSQLVLYEAQ